MLAAVQPPAAAASKGGKKGGKKGKGRKGKAAVQAPTAGNNDEGSEPAQAAASAVTAELLDVPGELLEAWRYNLDVQALKLGSLYSSPVLFSDNKHWKDCS